MEQPEHEGDMGCPKEAVQVPDERRAAILDLLDTGARQCDISTFYGMPQSIVSNIIPRERQSVRLERRGRKLLQTPRAT